MSKRNQKEQKAINNLHKYFPKNPIPKEKSPPPTADKIDNKKKAISSNDEVRNSKEKSVVNLNPTKKLQLSFILKSTSIDQIILKCPKISIVIQQIESRSGLYRELILSLLKKYLQSSSHSLWSIKYAPSNCEQLFNFKAGQKIRNWLKGFFEYKNKIKQESDSFINQFQDQKSCRIYRNIVDQQWRLEALVVQGAPGMGKSAAVKAIAYEMGLDMQECGNDYNQTKYLKQKNESTQSESVKTNYSHNIKTQKNSQRITKFMHLVEKEKPSDTKKGQLLHNIGVVFPQTEANKFYSQLSRCVQRSKIPFIMTSTNQSLPHQCRNYDIINFQTGNTDKIERVLWAIIHIEQLLHINKFKQMTNQKLFEQLNIQTSKVQFVDVYPLTKIRQVCRLFNYRLDTIFTFLQQYYKQSQIDLSDLWIKKCRSYNSSQFLNQILMINFEEPSNSIEGKQKITSEDQASTQDSECNGMLNEAQFHQHLGKLKILTAQDAFFNHQQHQTSNGATLDLTEWQQHPHTCIDITVHKNVHKGLVRKVNEEINVVMERGRSTLRLNELHVLPMLFREKRAASRNFRSTEESYFKYFNANQRQYLRLFCHLLNAE